jgi:hypothetical protein
MGVIKDTWDEFISGGEAVTETYNGGGSSSSPSGSSGGRNMDADMFAGSNYVATANTGNEGSGTNSDGAGVRVNSDLAGYMHSGAYNDGNNYIPEEEVAFYTENPNTTITAEMYEKGKKISKIFGALAGPIGLGARAIVELQRKGILPGVSAESYFEANNIPDTTGSEADNKISQMIADGATNEEITDELNKMAVQGELQNKVDALDTMKEAAYGDSKAFDAISNPGNFFSDTAMADQVPTLDANAEGLLIDNADYTMPSQAPIGVDTITNPALINQVTPGTAVGYNVETVDGKLSNPEYVATAQQGTVSQNSLVDANSLVIDTDATAKGQNEVGKALNEYASTNISRIIDTSTAAGKLLANKLGEGNYTDSKATILGQMEIISDEFKDANGNPKIPAWAQATARSISRTISFGGMSGSAALAATSNAMMEATLGIAEKEAAFFQTLTIENMNNRQEALINKASVLANFEMANLDARTTAAVTNAKAFLQMDLANLDNRQQTEMLNTQIRVDGLFEDAKAINAERLFSADAQNDFTKFYDNLSMQVDMHRADTLNEMARFNVGEINDNREFQANLDLKRETFYKEMQYNIDLANAKQRLEITLAEAEMEFAAAKIDVENMYGITSEALNRTWDREDAYFDYIWKSSETELERYVDLYEIDKEYEVEMRKVVNAEDLAKGAADWELFKWGTDLVFGDDFDIWDAWG